MTAKLAPSTMPTCSQTAEKFLRKESIGVHTRISLDQNADYLRVVVKGENQHGDEIVFQVTDRLPLDDRKAIVPDI